MYQMGFLHCLTLLLTITSSKTFADDALMAAALVHPTAIINPSNNYVTQNVYGFADFTTTIGNTVMIFSPHSVAAAPGL